MSAPITEAHLALARTIESFEVSTDMAAQLIADSEAQACDQLRAEITRLDAEKPWLKEANATNADLRAERDWLKTWQDQAETNYVIGEPLAKKLRDTEAERDQLRAETQRLGRATTNGQLAWMQESDRANARADRAELQLKDWNAAADASRQPNAFYDGYSEAQMRAMQAMLTKAEAELHALRLVCGTTDADKFSTWVDRANARADEAEHDCRVLIVQLNAAEAELKAEQDIRVINEIELKVSRAIVSKIWVQLGSPTYEQLKGRSIYDLIDELKAELAKERARLDWLMAGGVCMVQHTGGFHVSRLHAPVSRAAIDDAMKEETK